MAAEWEGWTTTNHLAVNDGADIPRGVSAFFSLAAVQLFRGTASARRGGSNLTSIAIVAPRDRLIAIIDSPRSAIASAQAPRNPKLAPRTFGGGIDRGALPWANAASVHPRLEL